MTVYHETLTLPPGRAPSFRDITKDVEDVLARAAIRRGLVVVFSQHTTCSVLIQEASDDVDYWGTELLMQDLVEVFEKLIPTCRTQGQFRHPGPKHIEAALSRHEQAAWSLNTDAHLRSVLLGRSQSIPVEDGALMLGDFGRIYFADFDHTRSRERMVRVQIVGD